MFARRLLAWLPLFLAVWVAGVTPAESSSRYDPRLRFRTLSTARFDIHFHQGEEAQARRLATLAEAVAAELDKTLGPASGRVQVILVDQNDLSNGWATSLPFNTIEITAAAPGGASLIGNTDDWLRMVFAHEYTHVVHLSRGQGWIGGLRRVMGRMPLLYPNLYLPTWQIEGLAVHEESAITGQGRVPDRNFRAILDVASAASRLEPIDRASGGLVDWPSGQTPYVYGTYFHQFLAQRQGEASLRQLADATAGRIPYLGSGAFKKVYGRSLGDLWREFESSRAATAPNEASSSVTRLTRHGFSVGSARFRSDGRLYYSISNPQGFPSLHVLDAPTGAEGAVAGESRKVVDRYLGSSVAFAGSRIVFDQMEIEQQVGLQSDLYALDADGEVRRLTHGVRAAAPDLSPDGTTMACTIQRADRRELATMLLSPDGGVAPAAALISEAGVHFNAPRWSPDGRWIAAERVSLEGRSEIVLIDVAAGRVSRAIAPASGSRSVTPAWLADGRLLFASDRDGDGFRIFVADIQSGMTSRLDGTGANVTGPEPSPDARTLAYVGYTPEGYDLFALPLEGARWTPIEVSVPRTAGAAAEVSPSQDLATAYSPRRTIAPRFWTPTLESDADEIVVGAATGATDALGRHFYAAEVGWSAGRGRPDWQLAYAYDRWRPTIFANLADDTDPWRDGTLRSTEANLGLLFPIRRVRWSQSLLGAFHSSLDRFRCSTCTLAGQLPSGAPAAADGDEPEIAIARRALRGGWSFNDSRSYGYSISREQGWTATVATEVTREALGADGNADASSVDVRGYVPVMPRHAVLAARIAAAASRGDRNVRRTFSASGSDPQAIGFDFGTDAVGLIRGVDEDETLGTRAAVLNVDYRFPLARIDRGLGTWPFFARVLHAAVFADTGHAWTDRFRRTDMTVSLGAELSLDTVVGYSLPLTFTAGAAWINQDRGVAAFARIGRAF